MRILPIPAVLAAAMLLGAPPAAAEEIRGDYHEEFPVSPGAVLKLSHGDGDVFLETWDRDVIDVKVRYRASFAMVGVGSKPAFSVEFVQEGDEVRVTGREKGVAMVGIFLATNVSEYVYEIQAPPYVRLDSRGQDGDLNLSGLRAEVRARVDDGDVSLADIRSPRIDLELEDGDFEGEDLEGPLTVHIEDGDLRLMDTVSPAARLDAEDGTVDLRGCSGLFAVRTEDGDVDMREQAAGELEVQTQDGDVRLDVRPSDAPLQLDITVQDGDVDLALDAGLSAAFLLATDDGHIRLDAPHARNVEESRNRAYGELGDADGEVRVRSQDGDLSLRTSGSRP